MLRKRILSAGRRVPCGSTFEYCRTRQAHNHDSRFDNESFIHRFPSNLETFTAGSGTGVIVPRRKPGGSFPYCNRNLPCCCVLSTRTSPKQTNMPNAKSILLCAVLAAIGTSINAQGRSSLFIKGMIRSETHQFDVTNGPDRWLGEFTETNTNRGAGLGYRRAVNSRFFLSTGIDYWNYRTRIRRMMNLRVFDDYTKPLYGVTDTRYHLLGLPFAADFAVFNGKRSMLLLGTAFTFNFTFSQTYRVVPAETFDRFYFFGVNNTVSIAYEANLSNKMYIQLRPFLNTFETWRKDTATSENSKHYWKSGFNSFGASLSIGYHLK
jgi:opacity protein-like surface antigen